MANKVASKRWIYSNFSVGSSSNECATKTEILGFGLYITNDSSYAGDICDIYVFENSRYKLVKSFKLQTGKQTVNI